MYKKIMVPLDGSDLAECALEHVKAIALGCGVPEVILFRVVEPIYTGADAMSYGAVMYADLVNQIEKTAQEYITDVTARFKKDSGIEARPMVTHGGAADEILEYSKKNQVDLIIMTTHGRSGVSRWLFGNVADKVSRHSTVPVLVIAPPGCRLEDPDQNKKTKN